MEPLHLDPEDDVVAGAEELLRRAAEPRWRRLMRGIGQSVMIGMENFGNAFAPFAPNYPHDSDEQFPSDTDLPRRPDADQSL